MEENPPEPGKGSEMTQELVFLDFIQTEEGETGPAGVRLATKSYPSDEKGLISLTQTCSTLEEFEQEVRHLKDTMDELIEKARSKVQQFQSEAAQPTVDVPYQTPQEFWTVMEACESFEEMREIFNNLGLHERQEVADYIFTGVNIFQGAASTFSQHYNEKESLLE